MSKQYLLLCNEDARIQLEAVLKNIQFLEIQGMNINGENKFNLLVTPVIPPVNQVELLPPIPINQDIPPKPSSDEKVE